MLDELKRYNYWADESIYTGYFRKHYVDTIIKYLDNRLVKVILGQRRVGKSYLLRMIIQVLHREGVPPRNILYINKDIAELGFIDNSERLLEVIREYRRAMTPEGKVYIILDEVQDIKNWEKAVNSLSQDYKFDYEVFITGSNANLLSMELATYLTGRYVGFEVFPFSYKEYLGYHSLERNKQTFLAYLKNGGIPESFRLKDVELRKNYLSALKDSIVLKDIVKRHQVRDIHLLEKLLRFVIDSIGALFSVNKVVNYLNSAGHKCKAETIGNYLSYLKEAYLVHESERYDIKGKRILGGEKK
ncbi:MAG: ATP-binding protein, partial [bacterium]|nr:ATP-binding protein [bacterium]